MDNTKRPGRQLSMFAFPLSIFYDFPLFDVSFYIFRKPPGGRIPLMEAFCLFP